MYKQLSVWPVIVALILSVVALPIRSAEAQTNVATQRLVVPVQGTVNGVANTLSGSLAINRFAVQNGQLMAVGTLTASVLDGAGNILNTIVRPVALPVAAANGSCQILHLVLGPLDLNVLGLVIHLNQVVLDITAQPGPGNLLGNLLCSIAGLLDSNTLGQQLANLLNRLLGALATV